MAGPPLKPGLLLGGRFELESELASGSEGHVFVARDTHLRVRVCVKVLRAHFSSEEAREKFNSEARVARKLESARVVDVYDVGWHGDRPFLVMPCLRGESVHARIQREGALNPEEAEHYLRGMLEALSALHEARLLHRDISPGNVFLRDDAGHRYGWAFPVLLDFGLSMSTGSDADGCAGSIGFLAPEIAGGSSSTESSDLYSVAAVMFTMLTGEAPRPGAEPIHETHRFAGKVPRRLSVAVAKALRVNPQERFSSTDDFLSALDAPLEDLEPGYLVNGIYELVEVLGRGGGAIVWSAHDRDTDELCALKFASPPEAASEAEKEVLYRRFEREAKILNRLNHPHVVDIRVGDVWNGVPFAVLERVHGKSLAEAMPTLSFESVLQVIGEVAMALDTVHELGVVHRDVKPSNILLRSEPPERVGSAVLIDFGVARWGDVALTVHGTVGTHGRLTPESLRSEPTGPFSDQWALAAIAYEALTGRLPGQANQANRDTSEISWCVERGEIEPVESLCPAAEKRQAAAIMRALSTNPLDRFSTCGDFVTALSGLKPLAKSISRRPKERRSGFRLSALGLAVLGASVLLSWSFAGSTATEPQVVVEDLANIASSYNLPTPPMDLRKIQVAAKEGTRSHDDVEVDINGKTHFLPTAVTYQPRDVFVVRVTDPRFQRTERTFVVTDSMEKASVELSAKRNQRRAAVAKPQSPRRSKPTRQRKLIYKPGEEDLGGRFYRTDDSGPVHQ